MQIPSFMCMRTLVSDLHEFNQKKKNITMANVFLPCEQYTNYILLLCSKSQIDVKLKVRSEFPTKTIVQGTLWLITK